VHVNEIRLWEDAAPGAVGAEPQDIPALTLHTPDKPDGSAIIVCPGGGYIFHADYEADPVADWLSTWGITGVVLRYRLSPRYHHPAPFQDLTRAVRLLRARSNELNLDPNRIGVMGFSAGGHLAAHVSTCFDSGKPKSPDAIERASSRPDVAVLVYPVISFTDLSHHTKTWEYLLENAPTSALRQSLSCETLVTSHTPATFLYHASGDPNVPVDNSFAYAAALRRAGVAFEMHLYDVCAHGVGLAQNHPTLNTWPVLCARWLAAKRFGRGLSMP